MEKIIKINGYEISKNLCTVAFNVRVQYVTKNTKIELGDPTGITHADLYDMIDRAVEVIEDKDITGKHAIMILAFNEAQFVVYPRK